MDSSDQRNVTLHECAHCVVARALLGPGAVRRVVIRDDGTGLMELHPSTPTSRGSRRIIAAASGIVDDASECDLSHYSDPEAWRVAREKARVLLDAHLPEFRQLVSDLEELGEFAGSHVDLVFELHEKQRAKPRHRDGGPLLYREQVWVVR
jgi:hypothetical protein